MLDDIIIITTKLRQHGFVTTLPKKEKYTAMNYEKFSSLPFLNDTIEEE